MRCSGLGEANARLITIGELDTGRFERPADRKFISNGEGKSLADTDTRGVLRNPLRRLASIFRNEVMALPIRLSSLVGQ